MAELLSIRKLVVGVMQGAVLTPVVKDIALSIVQGQTFALVGESGSGKSMTALSILRLLPDAGLILGGEIAFHQTDLNRLSERQLRRLRGHKIGMIFQDPATCLDPVMSVGHQILETVRLHTGLTGQAAWDKVVSWLTRVGIANAAQRVHDYPCQFSGGQKQRIMIAMALAAEPELLIADEPTTALDVQIQGQLLALLRDLQRELGMAILLITHDLGVVASMAHHVALMYRGEIVYTKPRDAFFNHPDHPYAQHLLAVLPSYQKRGHALSQGDWQNPHTEVAVLQTAPSHPHDHLVLSVKHLHVAFPIRTGLLRRISSWFPAVSDVSFNLHAGQTLAIVGESGCGKTTMAKALMRLLDPSVRLGGHAWLGSHQGRRNDLLASDRLALLRRGIQIVFQDPFASLNPRRRVQDILDEGMQALHPEWDASERLVRARSLLQRVGLDEQSLNRYPHEFSGGQRQRIAIARALAVEPKVLICDEPTSALDVSVQAQILDLLTSIQQETGMAYVFITHNFAVVEYFADEVLVMQHGRVVEQGAVDKVLHEPQHEYTRALLAAVPGV